MATGAYYNFRNILVPNYAKQGWTLTDNIGPNQIAKYILNNTILTRPDRVDPKDIGWMPIAVLIAKDEELASANLGICAIRREDLADVATILTGYKFRFSPTLNQMPLGILAQMATTTYFSTADFADANARIIDFTAKRDAYYIAVASKRENVQTVTEIVAFESGDDVICAISHYRSDFPMSPTVIEARAWIKEVRVLAP
jgi:hypothetical protein